MARPSKYNIEMAENFCLEIIDGKSVREICRNNDYPSTVTIFTWLNKNKEFLNQYETAKEIQADVMAEDIISIADNTEGEVQRDRLRIDARKWVASKLKPKKYGTGSQVNIVSDDKKITTVYLTTHFGKPMNLEGLSDEEVIKLARDANKKVVDDYKNESNQH